MAKVGFIGASGLMGHGMAKHLLLKGHALTLSVNRNAERVADLIAAGAVKAASPADVARACEFLILCVTGTPQVEAVMEQVLPVAPEGLTVIDCSTSEPESTSRLRTRCAAQGITFVDAPLSRSPVQAEEGRLNVMVGAERALFERIEPVLRAFAENVLHVGGPGAGHTIKLINNFIGQAVCAATAEAFAVGQRAGVDLKQLVALVGSGPVNSGLFQSMAKTLDGQLDGLLFELDNARKDMRYYTHLAESLAVPSLIGEAVHQNLTVASALGHGRKYVPSLVEAQEQLSGTTIVPRSQGKP